MNCPTEKCILHVKRGKVWCSIHNKYLKIKHDWENKTFDVAMKHILYVASSNGKNGEILIDEEV